MRAKDIMSTDVVTVRHNAKIRDLMNLLHEQEITGAPVLDGEGKLCGIVSEKDIIRSQLMSSFHAEQHEDLSDLFSPVYSGIEMGMTGSSARYVWVEQIMTRDVVTVMPEAPVEEIARLLVDNHFHRLPVVDGANKILGIITTIDLIKLLM